MIQERCKCCGLVLPNQDNLKTLTLEDIIPFVERVTGISHEEMLMGTQLQDVVRAKYIIYYFAYYYTATGMTKIGRVVGQAHHATVLHGARRIDFNVKIYVEIRDAVNQVMKMIVDGGFRIYRQEFRYSPRDLKTNEI